MDLDEYLSGIANNPRMDAKVRDLAHRTLVQWRDGVIPSQKVLKVLKTANTKPHPCEKMEHDGACAWLRQSGAVYNLSVPPPGQRAICVFPNNPDQCPGYRKPTE